MSYWGKLVGGMAGFALGGPFGAVVGAAFGHAADTGSMRRRLTSSPFPRESRLADVYETAAATLGAGCLIFRRP